MCPHQRSSVFEPNSPIQTGASTADSESSSGLPWTRNPQRLSSSLAKNSYLPYSIRTTPRAHSSSRETVKARQRFDLAKTRSGPKVCLLGGESSDCPRDPAPTKLRSRWRPLCIRRASSWTVGTSGAGQPSCSCDCCTQATANRIQRTRLTRENTNATKGKSMDSTMCQRPHLSMKSSVTHMTAMDAAVVTAATSSSQDRCTRPGLQPQGAKQVRQQQTALSVHLSQQEWSPAKQRLFPSLQPSAASTQIPIHHTASVSM
mmetsp:Transcript_85988/g.271101  ORF Transcript_85988/g.271101 Transcript_85988/m.271101 type:complete len:260 (-) Transcript_85988:602-1381(-)